MSTDERATLDAQLDSLADEEAITELCAIAQNELTAESPGWFYDLGNKERDLEVSRRALQMAKAGRLENK